MGILFGIILTRCMYIVIALQEAFSELFKRAHSIKVSEPAKIVSTKTHHYKGIKFNITDEIWINCFKNIFYNCLEIFISLQVFDEKLLKPKTPLC